MLDFYQFDESIKVQKKTQATRLPRGAAGVAYGNPANLLDAAKYVKHAWDQISTDSIRHAFKKAEIILGMEMGVENEEADFMDTILQQFDALNIAISKEELNQYVYADDDGNDLFSQALLDDIESSFAQISMQEMSEDDANVQDTTSACAATAENEVCFNGFNKLYQAVLDIEDQLQCADVQMEAGNQFEELMDAFDCFQGKLRKIVLQANGKKNQSQSTV